jgi:flagellar protein FliO/FliZ
MEDLQLSYLKFVLALVVVLALIALLTFAARRLGFARTTRGRGNRRRLAIAEVMPVDARRRLVLLKRDNVEHLVLLGPTQDLLIETLTPPRFSVDEGDS